LEDSHSKWSSFRGSGHFKHPDGNEYKFVYVARRVKHAGKRHHIAAPSAPALFLSLALKASERAQETLADLESTAWERYFDCLEHLAAAVIFSFTAIEAYVNELLPESLKYVRVKPSGKTKELDKRAVERYVPLEEKLDQVLPQVLGLSSPRNRGRSLWRDFTWLKQHRDRLIHLKFVDLRKPEAGQDAWALLLNAEVCKAPRKAVRLMRYLSGDGVPPKWLQNCPV
jgi:hypothetical protein